ncbi:MAG: hypothetical protein MMC33_003578 [Icmadophila ericetorum]|nr:hypothetical protein [Icmadophila ericetorum]
MAKDQLSQSLVKVYAAILQYLSKAKRYYDWNTADTRETYISPYNTPRSAMATHKTPDGVRDNGRSPTPSPTPGPQPLLTRISKHIAAYNSTRTNSSQNNSPNDTTMGMLKEAYLLIASKNASLIPTATSKGPMGLEEKVDINEVRCYELR